MNRPLWPRFLGLALLTLVFSCLILFIGDTPWSVVWEGVKGRVEGEVTGWNPLLDERLPRLIVILCSGASLAVAGAVTQSLFRNPLASPSVLGITSGGSLCVMIGFINGWHLSHPFALPLTAFVGCITTLLAVYTCSRYQGKIQMNNVILNGIAVSTVLSALQHVTLYILRDHWSLVQTLTEWEAGSTADRSWQHVHMQLPLTIIGLLGCWAYRQELNILALGEEEARNLGLNVEAVRWRLFLFVALLTGGALAAIGMIAFFGLLLPHMIRKLYGPNNKQLIPLCALGGSLLLAGMEVFLRATGTYVFTIGHVSAMLGGGFFLLILVGEQRRTLQGI